MCNFHSDFFLYQKSFPWKCMRCTRLIFIVNSLIWLGCETNHCFVNNTCKVSMVPVVNMKCKNCWMESLTCLELCEMIGPFEGTPLTRGTICDNHNQDCYYGGLSSIFLSWLGVISTDRCDQWRVTSRIRDATEVFGCILYLIVLAPHVETMTEGMIHMVPLLWG